MPLARLNHERTVRTALGGGYTIATILDLIYTLMHGTDGWTVEKDLSGGATTEGLLLTPPGLSGDLGIGIVIGGKATTPAPTMLTPDTAVANVLLVGIIKDIITPGTLNWDHASPVGDGTFSGLWRGMPTGSNTHLVCVYSEEDIIIALDNNVNGTCKAIMAGASYDPMGGSAESTGRLYGMSVIGGIATTGMYQGQWSHNASNSATANAMFVHGTTNAHAHSGIFEPGGSGWYTGNKAFMLGPTVASSPNLRANTGGPSLQIPVAIDFDGYGRTRLREKFISFAQLHGITTQESGPTDTGHTVGSGLTTESDCIFCAAKDNSW